MKPARPAILAVLVVAGLVLSGCASSDTTSSSSSSSTKPTTTSRTTTEPPIIITNTVTQTVTVTPPPPPPPPTSSSSPPPPPPPPGGGTIDQMPEINSTRLISRTPNFAQVGWNVSDDSPSVVSRVEYGAGAGNYSLRTADQPGVGPHTAGLPDLRSCTTYSFRVTALDSAGHSSMPGLPNPATFQTNGTAPGITNVQVANVMHTGITIRWNVTGPADTRSQVFYGTSALTSSLPATTGTGPRSATIPTAANTVYNIQIRATNPCGSLDAPATPLSQRSAELIHVDINGAQGSANSFSPGSTVAGPLNLIVGRYYVFEVKNKETCTGAGCTHTFNIEPSSPAYNSGPISGGGVTYVFPASIKWNSATTLHMRCSYHNSGPSAMDGIINVA